LLHGCHLNAKAVFRLGALLWVKPIFTPWCEYLNCSNSQTRISACSIAKVSSLTVICTTEKACVDFTYAFSQTWKKLHLIFLFNIDVVTAIVQTLFKTGAGAAQPAF